MRKVSWALDPRRYWPKSLLKELDQNLPDVLERFKEGGPKTIISETVRPQEGRALCMYGDAGWGTEVARGKYQSSRLSDALVKAAADLIPSMLNPAPPPQ